MRQQRKLGAYEPDSVQQPMLTARALAEHPALLRDVINQMHAGVVVVDMQGQFLIFNTAAKAMLGAGPINDGPQAWSEHFGVYWPDMQTSVPTDQLPLARALAGETVDDVHLYVRHDGLPQGVHLNVSSQPLRDARGVQVGGIVSFSDITKMHELAEEAAYFAEHDMLTGLLNRRAFETRLATLLSKASSRRAVGVVLLDLDRLKLINDTVGHDAGDQAILSTAQTLARVCGEDTVARLNGDEFVILLPDTQASKLQAVGDAALAALRQLSLKFQGHQFSLSASAGGLLVQEQGLAVDDVMGAISGACQDAKSEGRDRLQIESTARQSGNTTSRAQMQQLLTLERALADGRLRLAMEPMQPTRAHAVPMSEMLIRLVDEQGVTHRPGRYLVAAERFNRMQKIDLGVCAAVLRYLEANPAGAHRVSINLSADSVRDSAATRLLLDLLAAYPAQASQLTIEVTETAALGELAQAVALTHKLHDLGCHVALDDFGAGFSNFAYLKRLAVDYLKIDGSLIQGMLDSQVDSAIVRSLIDLCRTLRLSSIAEFVDSQPLIDALTMMGVDYLQGYSIGKAQAVDAVVMSDPMSLLPASH